MVPLDHQQLEVSHIANEEVPVIDRILTRCSRNSIVPFEDLFPQEVLLQSVKVTYVKLEILKF